MNFFGRFKFYLLGVIAGSFLVILLFGRRSSCRDMATNYMPGGRVLLEMSSKPILYSNPVLQHLNNSKVDTATFRTKIMPELDINFDQSDQRAKPCGKYVAYYNDSRYHWKVDLEKCKEKVEIVSIEDYSPTNKK